MYAHGFIEVTGEQDIQALCAYWAERANPTKKDSSFPEIVSGTEMEGAFAIIREWADDQLVSAEAAEGNCSPVADVSLVGDLPDSSGKVNAIETMAFILWWSGTMTPGRSIRVTIWPAQGRACLTWQSATGKPSSFLNIEGLLKNLATAKVYEL